MTIRWTRTVWVPAVNVAGSVTWIRLLRTISAGMPAPESKDSAVPAGNPAGMGHVTVVDDAGALAGGWGIGMAVPPM